MEVVNEAQQKVAPNAEQLKQMQAQQDQLRQYVDSQVNVKLATYNLDVQRLLIGAQTIEALCNSANNSVERQNGELIKLEAPMSETLMAIITQLHKAFVTKGEGIEEVK